MRFLRIFFVALLPFVVAAPSFAAQFVPFDAALFAAAQNTGQPILVDIRASWCPTCAAQKPILDRLTTEPAFKKLVVFTVDFDTQKDVVRNFHADMQSTLIVFKGKTETGRSVGDTNEGSIARLL